MGPPPAEAIRRGRTFSRRGFLDLASKVVIGSALGALSACDAPPDSPSSSPKPKDFSTIAVAPETVQRFMELPSPVGARLDLDQEGEFNNSTYIYGPHERFVRYIPSVLGTLDRVELSIDVVGGPSHPLTAGILESASRNGSRTLIAKHEVDAKSIREKKDPWMSFFTGMQVKIRGGNEYIIYLTTPDSRDDTRNAYRWRTMNIDESGEPKPPGRPYNPHDEILGVRTFINTDARDKVDQILESRLEKVVKGDFEISLPPDWSEGIRQLSDAPNIEEPKRGAILFNGDRLAAGLTHLIIRADRISRDTDLDAYRQSTIRQVKGNRKFFKPRSPIPIRVGKESGLFTTIDTPTGRVHTAVSKTGEKGYSFTLVTPPPFEAEQVDRFTKILASHVPR